MKIITLIILLREPINKDPGLITDASYLPFNFYLCTFVFELHPPHLRYPGFDLPGEIASAALAMCFQKFHY